ncbi:MAG: hypothetical protein JRH07_19880 [Deltaproteobacteria bacterium]|nr:hypothetical protein [Deltaproteobacteria bacterium]
MSRREIQPDEKITVRMTERDRELLQEHTFCDPEYAERLRPASNGEGLVGEYTLDELDDILGYVAAEANHTEDEELRRELDALYDRLFRTERALDDGHWNDSVI